MARVSPTPKDFRQQFHDLYLNIRTQLFSLAGDDTPSSAEDVLQSLNRLEQTIRIGRERLIKQAQAEGYNVK